MTYLVRSSDDSYFEIIQEENVIYIRTGILENSETLDRIVCQDLDAAEQQKSKLIQDKVAEGYSEVENPQGESFDLSDFDLETLKKYRNPKDFDEESFWDKGRKFFSKIPFARDVLALYYAYKDPAVPSSAKLLILAGLAYFISPIDAIPDFLGLLGFTDDAAAIALVIGMLGKVITNEHFKMADDYFSQEGTDEDSQEGTDDDPDE